MPATVGGDNDNFIAAVYFPVAFSSPLEATDICPTLSPENPIIVHVEQVPQSLCQMQSWAVGVVQPLRGFHESPEI